MSDSNVVNKGQNYFVVICDLQTDCEKLRQKVLDEIEHPECSRATPVWHTNVNRDTFAFPTVSGDYYYLENFFIKVRAKIERKSSEFSRENSRQAWENINGAALGDMLVDHVKKGDPVDIAAFCAFFDTRGFNHDFITQNFLAKALELGAKHPYPLAKLNEPKYFPIKGWPELKIELELFTDFEALMVESYGDKPAVIAQKGGLYPWQTICILNGVLHKEIHDSAGASNEVVQERLDYLQQIRDTRMARKENSKGIRYTENGNMLQFSWNGRFIACIDMNSQILPADVKALANKLQEAINNESR